MKSLEKFIHLVWQNGWFDSSQLVTSEGEPVVVLDRGRPNTAPGPDFLNARLSIGGLTLAGNVEIHVNGREWYDHGHHTDPAYGSVILHVVESQPVATECQGRMIPCVVIGPLISPVVVASYGLLMQRVGMLPCSGLLSERRWPPDRMVIQWHSSAAARLQARAQRLAELARHAGLTDNEVAWAALLRALGFGVNSEPFQMLAARMPWSLLARHRDKPFTLAAIIYGMAGLLDFLKNNSLAESLKKEFSFFRNDISSPPLEPLVWRFGGTRPGNFPTHRVHLFLRWVHRNIENVGDFFINAQSLEELKKFLMPTPLPEPLESTLPSHHLSRESLHLLVINAVAPFLAYLNEKYQQQNLFEKAVRWLERLPPEHNRYVKQWHQLGYAPSNAFESQGILELYSTLCRRKGCMHCSIGQAILKSTQ